MIYFATFLSAIANNIVAQNKQTNVVVTPYPSIKNLAALKNSAPNAVDTIARVDKTVPRSLDSIE